MTEDPEAATGGERLNTALRTIASREQIAEALGIQDLDSDAQANAVADEAEALLADGTLRYEAIRQWWLNRGLFEYSLAIDRRRERDYLANSALRVLFVLEEGGAKYLAYSEDFTVARLVDREKDAFQFVVKSVSELDKGYRLGMAKNFDALKAQFKARQVKVLGGARS